MKNEDVRVNLMIETKELEKLLLSNEPDDLLLAIQGLYARADILFDKVKTEEEILEMDTLYDLAGNLKKSVNERKNLIEGACEILDASRASE